VERLAADGYKLKQYTCKY